MNRRDFTHRVLPCLALGAAPALAQQPPGGGDPGSADKPPVAYDEDEKRLLDILDEIDKRQRRGSMSVPAADGRLLRLLTAFRGAKHVVELGTSVGYSGIWFCLALRGTGGKLTTFDIDPGRIKQARENFKKAGVADRITLIEGDAHKTVKQLKDPIDLLFIDADKEGYLDYLTQLRPLVPVGGLIVAHNMARPRPDPRFVEAITTDKALDTVFLNMHAAGVALTLKKA